MIGLAIWIVGIIFTVWVALAAISYGGWALVLLLSWLSENGRWKWALFVLLMFGVYFIK